jgi:chemotaxis response regulator CheB
MEHPERSESDGEEQTPIGDGAPERRGPKASDIPVVCVGGSAGALDAYIRLLRHLPSDLDVAVVVVNHMREAATHLPTILARYTDMPVELITDGLKLLANRVYVIPPQRDLHVLDGEFRLNPISKPRGWPNVIEVFLRSLARHWSGQMIAVVVSGLDGDGARALSAIHAAGGITIAQKPDTSEQPDMPESSRLRNSNVPHRLFSRPPNA